MSTGTGPTHLIKHIQNMAAGLQQPERAKNPRKLVVVRDWKDTLTTVKSPSGLRWGAKKGKMAHESVIISTIAKSMK